MTQLRNQINQLHQELINAIISNQRDVTSRVLFCSHLAPLMYGVQWRDLRFLNLPYMQNSTFQ